MRNIINFNPYYIVGLCDGEPTFTVSIVKDSRPRKNIPYLLQEAKKQIFSVHPSFAVSLNIKNKDLIHGLASYFRVGNVKSDVNNNALTFYVNSVKQLISTIIPFFEKYPLISEKQADFILFKSIISLMDQGKHFTLQGLNDIISIKASMNKGISDKLRENFNDINAIYRPNILNKTIKSNHWLAGFADGEGSFYIRIIETDTVKKTNRVSFFFSISQSCRERQLLCNILEILDCGTISTNGKYIQFRVTKFEDIKSKVIPFFKQYSLQGIKKLDFEDFSNIMELVKSNLYLTDEHLEEIKYIKQNMSLKRSLD